MPLDIDLIEQGKRTYKSLKRFADEVKVGDKIWMPEDHLAIDHDSAFADGFWFTVVKKYKDGVLLEKPTTKGVHRQCIAYYKIYMFGKRRLYG